MGYITQTKDYWIAPNAVTITLNALGDANRIQGSVASGAVISCYIEAVQPGGDNGDGLQLDNGRNPKRWPLSLSPTYFNSDSAKYVYAAIPRSASIGSQAVVVFPSEQIDIYGKNASDTQIGSAGYFYIFLQGIISEVYTDASDNRQKRRMTHACDWGALGTYEDLVKVKDSEWYRYDQTMQVVTLLKEIVMADGSKFRNLKAVFAEIDNYLQLNGDRLTGVAVSPDDDEATDKIVTPAYLDEFGNTRYLSKQHDDTAAGLITFLQGLVSGTYHRDAAIGPTSTDTGAKIFPDGTGDFINLVFSQLLKSKNARSGFLDGTGILMDAAKGMIEADGMEVRGFLKVMELVINRLQLMESDYSFTEGDTTERVDFSDGGQRMVLTMHKEHDNDHTPFYPGDILYAKVNNLLDHGTYYTCWVRVISVDQANNTIKVAPYPALKPTGDRFVPGARNFTFLGTEIDGADFSAELLHDYELYPNGYEKILNLTRHGNVADGLLDGDDPTSYSDEVLQSQKGRQQSWVLSTTDKRLSFFWNVDEPIVRDENYALCLGILPDLANLPSDRNKAMPSLYVNTIFYDFHADANYPAKVIKEDRGQWVLPDSTIPQPSADMDGTPIFEPYHYRTYTNLTWHTYRDNPAWASKTDAELRDILNRKKVDLEVSRVWNHGIIWECLVDGTTQEPCWGCTDWIAVGGDTVYYCEITSSAGTTFRNGNVSTILTMEVRYGQEVITDRLAAQPGAAIVWGRCTLWNPTTRRFEPTSEDEAWTATPVPGEPYSIRLERSDLGSGWMTDYRQALIHCSIYAPDADGSTEEYPADFITSI